ncbi:hypothetical protein [Pararhizobium mangrovi]|uniref:hypothetical protein n=1 Tax=Pararhizobium mangrovi TaxID=2590452 RepID=UPI0015E83B9E|nr:hypothetical protein [Pararhizobium mangrovi]
MRHEAFIETKAYHHMIDLLRDVKTCPVTGERSVDEIMRIIGEVGNVWPEAIRPAEAA